MPVRTEVERDMTADKTGRRNDRERVGLVHGQEAEAGSVVVEEEERRGLWMVK